MGSSRRLRRAGTRGYDEGWGTLELRADAPRESPPNFTEGTLNSRRSLAAVTSPEQSSVL